MDPGFFWTNGRRGSSVFAVALVACILGLGGSRPAAAAPGDLNGDTVVDMQDVVLALEIAGGLTESDIFSATDGDVAGGPGNTPDGKVSLLDAVRIARAVNGLDDLGGGGPGDPPAVLPKMDSITFAANFSKSYQLDPAYRLTGTVADSRGQSISSFEQVGQLIRNTSGEISFDHATNVMASDSASVNFGEFDFSAVAAPGQNNVTIFTYVSEFNTANGTSSTYSVVQNAVPATLNVVGDSTGLSFVRPDLPAPGTLMGTVSGSNFTPTSVVFSTESGIDASATVTGTNYSMKSGPGTGALDIFGNLTGEAGVLVYLFQTGSPVTVASGATTTRNVTIPTLATLTGTVTAPNGLKAAAASISNFQGTQNEFSSSNALSDTDQAYKLAIPPGTYNLSVSLPQQSFGNSHLNLSYGQQVTLNAGENTRNITIPAIPANVTFTGTITGPGNTPVPDVNVDVYGTVANNFTAYAFTQTGANGTFSLTLPPGSYTVFIYS